MASQRTRAKRPAKTPRLGPFKGSPFVEKIDGDAWQRLISELLEAELLNAGLAASDMERTLASNKGDGGIDAFIGAPPPRPTRFLTDGPRAFQFKRSFPGVARIVREVMGSSLLKPRLDSGTSHTLVVGTDLGDKRDAVVAALEAKFCENGLGGRVEVAGADWVLRLLKEHNFAWRYVPDAPAAALHLLTLDAWRARQESQGTQFPWTEDPARTEILVGLTKQLARPGRVLRLHGAPGVGKSRLALELASRFAASDRDVTVLEAYEAGAEDLVSFTGTAMRGLLIIDECTVSGHEAIQRNWISTRGSVLTIGSEDDRNLTHEASTAPWLPPLRLDELRELARTTSSTLPESLRGHLAERSGGYLKLLRLMLDAFEHAAGTPPPAVDFSDEKLFTLLVSFITEQNNHDDERARALRALALPTFVLDVHTELPVLERVVELPAGRLRDARRQLDRLALLGVLPGGLYVTPRLLGDWLAEAEWDGRECNLFARLKAAGASRSLIARCVQRLAGVSARGRISLLRLLSECRDRVEGEIGAETVGELVASLSATRPPDALGLARVLLEGRPCEPALGALGRALLRCAWEPELFAASATLLARFDPDGRSFSSLFGTVAGLTRANGAVRLGVLEELSSSPVDAVRLRVVQGLGEALAEEGSRFMPFPSLRIEDGWRPSTRGEELHYRRRAAELLEPRLSDAPAVAANAAEVARQALRSLVRSGFMPVAVQLVRAVVRAGLPLEPFRGEGRAVEQFDLQRLDADALEAWRTARDLLAPHTVVERAISFAAGPPSDGDARELAGLLVQDDALAELFEAFGREFSANQFRLGHAVGRLDTQRRWLGLVRSRAGSWRVLRFAAGYLVGLTGGVDDLLDELAGDGRLAALAFEATWLETPSPQGVQRLTQLFSSGRVLPQQFLDLRLGGWINTLGSEHASRLLDVLSPAASVAFRLAFQRVMGQEGDRSLMPALTALWRRLDLEAIREAAWEWLEVAPFIAPEIVAARCVDALRVALTGRKRLPLEVIQALSSAAARAPADTWAAIAETAASIEPGLRDALGLQLRDHLPGTEEVVEAVMTWVGDDSDRASLAAAIAGPIDDSKENLAARLLVRFPEDPVVRAHLDDRFMSGSFHHESDFWRGRLEALRTMARSLRVPLAEWANRMVPRVEQEFRSAAAVEHAFAEGVLEVPVLGEHRTNVTGVADLGALSKEE